MSEAEDLAKIRYEGAAQGTKRIDPNNPLVEDTVGAKGEDEFAVQFNFPRPERKAKPYGDGGIDFETEQYVIDVKTSQKEGHLLVKSKDAKADGHNKPMIYVRAHYDRATNVTTLQGWEWGSIVVDCPEKDFGKKGVTLICRYKPTSLLHSMDELHRLLGR
jgi:hypothetical protein